MRPLENMTDVELIETVMKSELDYDFRIHAAKHILKRIGVNVNDISQTTGLETRSEA